MLKPLILAFFLLPASVFAAAIPVFVSVLPLQYLVEKVGGNLVEVESMVGPGHNPVSYDPGPGQIRRLAGARMFVRTGVPYEDAWMDQIRQINTGMVILDARHELPVKAEAPAPGHEGEHHDLDPHVWTSPLNAIAIARSISDTLSQLDPQNRSVFQENVEAFRLELEVLHGQIKALLDAKQQRSFMVFHPAWGYFASTYNVNQVAVEQEGKTPGPRTFAELIETARANNISVIFVQPQFNTQLVEVVALETGAKIVQVDPLGLDFPAEVKRVAEALADDR